MYSRVHWVDGPEAEKQGAPPFIIHQLDEYCKSAAGGGEREKEAGRSINGVISSWVGSKEKKKHLSFSFDGSLYVLG